MQNRFILPLGLLFVANVVVAQQQPQRITAGSRSIAEPPTVIPDNCSVSEVLTVSTNGKSDAYNMLGYEVAALYAGHQAERDNALAVKSMNSVSESDPVGSLADTFQNLDTATDGYLCGAFIAGQYKVADKYRGTFRETTISVYNRLAIINTKMKEYAKDRMGNFDQQDANSIVKNANALAKLTNDRKAAISDLADAATLSALLSFYGDDPSAKVADTLNMSAAEREQLLVQLDRVLATGSPDSFTEVADLLKDFLTKHPKVRN